jgi:uncharacterized phage-associated protein
MIPAIDVARCLIRLAVTSGAEPDPLSHLRLQKLLYYAQSWHLAAFGTPLFRERIEAWRDGPVVADLWPHFTVFGHSSILPVDGEHSPKMNLDEQMFVRAVWDEYKKYSATQLSKMTHCESPWVDARGDLPASASSSEEITHEAMRAYFAPKLAARMPKGIGLDELIRAESTMAKGQYRTHAQLRASLKGG